MRKYLLHPSSIQGRLFWILAGLALSIVVSVNLIWLPSAIVEVQDAQAELRRLAVEGLAEQIESFLEEKEQDLKTEAPYFRLGLAQGNRAELVQLAQAVLKRELAVEEVGILDRDGKEGMQVSRRATSGSAGLLERARSPLFWDGLGSEISWGPVTIDDASEPVITLAVPLRRSEVAAAVVYFVLNLKSLWELTGHFDLNYGGRAYIVDSAGRLIAADRPHLVLKQLSFINRPMVRDLTLPSISTHHEMSHSTYRNENDVEVLACGISLPKLGWVVVVEQPKALLYAPIRQKLWFFGVIFSIGLAISFGLARFLSRRFTRPILALHDGVERISQGHLEHRVLVNTGDEIESLANDFNRMAGALNESRRRLENKVAERTSDLAALYAAMAPLVSTEAPELLRQVAHRLKDATGADAALVRILDKDTNFYLCPTNVGFPPAYTDGIRYLEPGSAVETVFSSGVPLISPDIAVDSRLKAKRQLAAGFRSCAFLPLRVFGDLRGIIHLASREPGFFNEQKKDHLVIIARQMSVAMENRELFEAAERRGQEQAALNVIAQATSQSLDRDELLKVSLTKILEMTGRERAAIRLKDFVTGKIILAAHRGFTPAEVNELNTGFSRACDEVWASGQPLLVNQGSEPDSQIILPQSCSVAWIPMKADARVVGILTVSTTRRAPFFQSEVDLLQAIANIIGVAIQKAQLFEESQQNLRQIRALRDIDQAINSTLDLQSVLALLLEKIEIFFPTNPAATTVRLFDKKTGLLDPVACRNLDEREWKSDTWKSGRGTSSDVLRTKAPVTITRVQSDARTKDMQFFVKHQLVSYLGVPLIAKGEFLGVLSFYTKEEHEFGGRELELLSTLAGQAAIAIHNARLYEQTRSREAELDEKNQELQKKTTELEQANKAKDEFLGIISHELRTPLNVVVGYSAMLKDGILGDVNAEQQEALGKVLARANDQLQMINMLLQATQLGAGAVDVKRENMNLCELLDEMRSGYDLPLKNEVRLQWDYSTELPSIKTDGEKLRHVLQNLIGNAIKFTEKGSITVSARAQHERGQVEVAVADTGVGIPKQMLPFIFEMFRQADSSDRRRFEGVGLGLFIVQKFTELIGGRVEVESEVGKGSIFKVTLPSGIDPGEGRSCETIIVDRRDYSNAETRASSRG